MLNVEYVELVGQRESKIEIQNPKANATKTRKNKK
jgi:hypothetical protein